MLKRKRVFFANTNYLIPPFYFTIIVLAVLVRSSTGKAGNTRAFFLGDEAAMTGGSGIAVTRDSGSVWYNPSGLGGLSQGRMELTATAYKLKLRHIKNFVAAKLPSETIHKDMRVNSFSAVPTSIVFVRNINDDISAGIAIYQTGNMVESIRIEMDESFPGGRWALGVESHEETFTYHIGPALGWRINPSFRIGFSLFVLYETHTGNQQEFLSIATGDSQGENNYAYLWSQYVTWKTVGVKIQAGLQWEFAENVHLGFVLRSPRMDFYNSFEAVYYDVEIDSDFSNFADGGRESDAGVEFFGGPDIETQLGLAYRNSKFWVGIEGAFRPPAESPNENLSGLSNEWLWNLSIGGRYWYSELLNLGSGIFTDRSVKDEPTVLMEEKTDRYGLCLGAEMRTPLRVKKDKAEKPLIWTTTLALVYSFEIGKIGTLYYAYPGWESDVRIRDALFHQILVHFGSSFYF